MTDDQVCITHYMTEVPRRDRPYPCNRRGQHYADCEGQEDGTCRGCVPRSATNGLLCPVCSDKFTDALSRLKWLISHLRSIDNGGQQQERVSTSMEQSLIIPDSWLAADGLMEALGSVPFRSTASIDQAIRQAGAVVAGWEADLDGRLNTEHGAQQAVVTVKRMQNALHKWPDAEAEYRHIPYVVCPTCQEKNLYRRAPLEYLDDIFVQCATDDCGYRHDWFDWLDIYAPIFEGMEKDMKRREREERRAEKEAS